MQVRRLLLVRHGETEGESSTRFHGATDVRLSALGRRQLLPAARRLRGEPVDLWVASNLQRSWSGTALVNGGAPIRLEPDLREVDFGEWEGLTKDEIRERDPVLFEAWQAGTPGFDYPGGERIQDFRARIARSLDRILASAVHTVAGVLHKGVIRTIVRQLVGELEANSLDLELGEQVVLTRLSSGGWILGGRGSNPAGFEEG